MEHTPGPWEAREYEVLSPRDKKGQRIIVAEALSSGDSGRANAKIMAASPNMLDTLKRITELAANKGETASVLLNISGELARAAIKAATS